MLCEMQTKGYRLEREREREREVPKNMAGGEASRTIKYQERDKIYNRRRKLQGKSLSKVYQKNIQMEGETYSGSS
jgi:hypothetical protein